MAKRKKPEDPSLFDAIEPGDAAPAARDSAIRTSLLARGGGGGTVGSFIDVSDDAGVISVRVPDTWSDLSRDRSEQRPDRFGVGEKFDAVVTQVDAKARKVSVSIKALEIADEKEAVAQYGSTDSGASLGDILGAALNKARGGDE